MKKQTKITAVVATLMLFLFSVGSALAKRVEFTGTRTRVPGVTYEEAKFAGCRLMRYGQVANYTISTDHPLINGSWTNFDNKFNREVIQYPVEGILEDCIPSDESPDPIPSPSQCVLGAGIVHGPFIIVVDNENHWEGNWKVLFNRDGTSVVKGTARGIGSVLDGLTMQFFDVIAGGSEVDFTGYIHIPK